MAATFSSGRISLSGGVVVVVVAVAVARRCITINLSSFLALSLCVPSQAASIYLTADKMVMNWGKIKIQIRKERENNNNNSNSQFFHSFIHSFGCLFICSFYFCLLRILLLLFYFVVHFGRKPYAILNELTDTCINSIMATVYVLITLSSLPFSLSVGLHSIYFIVDLCVCDLYNIFSYAWHMQSTYLLFQSIHYLLMMLFWLFFFFFFRFCFAFAFLLKKAFIIVLESCSLFSSMFIFSSWVNSYVFSSIKYFLHMRSHAR